jgi:hypothetical protein
MSVLGWARWGLARMWEIPEESPTPHNTNGNICESPYDIFCDASVIYSHPQSCGKIFESVARIILFSTLGSTSRLLKFSSKYRTNTNAPNLHLEEDRQDILLWYLAK